MCRWGVSRAESLRERACGVVGADGGGWTPVEGNGQGGQGAVVLWVFSAAGGGVMCCSRRRSLERCGWLAAGVVV